ncbi:MAG: M1 family metallopeptidase [Melioribacteraceae bacterium]|nr:M1 family metallopeptidase [Melioribacteraceae bacterium]
MKSKIIPLLLFFISIQIYPQTDKIILSERNAGYNIKVTLDTENKTLTGNEILYWKNITDFPVDELQFHLYLNAFKNTKSTFMKESGMRHRGFGVDVEDSLAWGWIDITSMKTGNEDLTKLIKFIHPDDDNIDDQTVISVPLYKSLEPGETIQVDIDFTAKLPKIMARTGFSDDYYLVGQWFPKIGVFENAGQRRRETAGWNCHQFHSNSEFYADFGVYNVDITVPEKFIVGATGVLQKEIKNRDNTKTLYYRANDVLDFAWTASPLFEVVEDKWKDVNIKVLLQPQHLAQAKRHTSSVKNALEYFEKHLGEFPYPSMTIVDPPFRGLASAGMEYPMFITAGCLWGIPDELKYTEMVTIHEFGHNYFMGILASNEFEEAWLDEGFNTYFENMIMDNYYGEKHSKIDLFGYHAGDEEQSVQGFTSMRNPFVAKINNYSWLYPNGGYGVSSYNKPAIYLSTLANLLGEKTSEKIMHTYFDRWKFKHPCGQDFIDIVNEVVKEDPGFEYGSDMNWYFNQMLNSTNVCDYTVSSISSERQKEDWGLFDKEGGKNFVIKEDNTTYKYETKTIITRLGEIKMPQEILIHFADGEEILEKWDGKSRMKTFTYLRNYPIDRVKIDPENKILFEQKIYNNSLSTKKETVVVWKYAAKFLFWIQNTMLTMFN